MVVRFIAENLALEQLGGTRRVICTVLWIGVLGTLGVSLAYLLVLFPLCMRTSYRRIGSVWGVVVGDLSATSRSPRSSGRSSKSSRRGTASTYTSSRLEVPR
jgi:hypothetical protein